MEYGVVPHSNTQIDQLKINADLNDDNKVYGFLFAGNTNKHSDIAPPTAPTARRPLCDPESVGADKQPPVQRR